MGKSSQVESSKSNEKKNISYGRKEIEKLSNDKNQSGSSKNDKKKNVSHDDKKEIKNVIQETNQVGSSKNTEKKICRVCGQNKLEIKTKMKNADKEKELGRVKKPEPVRRNPKMNIKFVLNPDKSERKMACPYCTEIVASFRESDIHLLLMHISRVHNDAGLYACWRCRKACTSANHLIEHVRGNHPEENKTGFKLTYGKVRRVTGKIPENRRSDLA